MNYAQINEQGICVAVLSTPSEINAPHMVAYDPELESPLGARQENGVWTQLAPVPETRHITNYAAKMRLTQAERIAIRSAAKVNEEVYDFNDLLDSARYIDLDHPETIAGFQALEASGLLAGGRAQAILSADVQPGERA